MNVASSTQIFGETFSMSHNVLGGKETKMKGIITCAAMQSKILEETKGYGG